ncbi:MAG: hypothetical protein HEQ32_05265 [Vampirovibrio sp.]
MTSWFKRFFTMTLIVLSLFSAVLDFNEADAAKPKKKGTAKTLPKEWGPYAPKLTLLLQKSQNKSFFTPQDGETLNELRQVSDDFQERYAKVKDVAPILYQLGLLFGYREMWFESYDAYSTIIERFPESPYANKARFQLSKIKRQLGEDYTMLEESRTLMTGPTTPPVLKKINPAPQK